jgi:hypothetical protein
MTTLPWLIIPGVLVPSLIFIHVVIFARLAGRRAPASARCSRGTALAESAVNSLVARRTVKKQQMQWSKRGAHLLLQVRAAVLNGDLRGRLTYKPPK